MGSDVPVGWRARRQKGRPLPVSPSSSTFSHLPLTHNGPQGATTPVLSLGPGTTESRFERASLILGVLPRGPRGLRPSALVAKCCACEDLVPGCAARCQRGLHFEEPKLGSQAPQRASLCAVCQATCLVRVTTPLYPSSWQRPSKELGAPNSPDPLISS